MKRKIYTAAAIILVAAVLAFLPHYTQVISYGEADVKFILDAGHGGLDGGASAADGTIESGLNLSICLKLDAIMGLCGYPTVLTRYIEDISYPESANTIHKKKVYDQKSRIELINSVENALVVSIHLNKFSDSQPRGAQVLYNGLGSSKELAEYMQAQFTNVLQNGNKRSAARVPKDIYLMKQINCPGLIVECGFLSNPDETRLLKTDLYQTKLAAIIAASCMKYKDIKGAAA
ncbi:MAG: N-acetylmuramoyl-L-alanine amidase [Papillibacter sp.]|nr:N-acetylmuramoyl-L-alanine amidase [Papillibacter sp.]